MSAAPREEFEAFFQATTLGRTKLPREAIPENVTFSQGPLLLVLMRVISLLLSFLPHLEPTSPWETCLVHLYIARAWQSAANQFNPNISRALSARCRGCQGDWEGKADLNSADSGHRP